MFLVFITFHAISLFEIRWALKRWDHSSSYRLNLYIGVVAMEMAFLNGYMWMFALDHSWELNFVPFLVIFVNTLTSIVKTTPPLFMKCVETCSLKYPNCQLPATLFRRLR
uniref:Uncharacterized protein n=1 Tax=Parascaris equorum TaxID=6256 RepID=A0A914RYW4_PAREQ